MARLSNAVQLFDACAAAIGLRTLLRNFLLLHPHRQGVSNEVLQEYLRFMALKLLLGDTAAPPKLSPPALVAEMWSTHVQDTRAYADFCRRRLCAVHGGRCSTAGATTVWSLRVTATARLDSIRHMASPPACACWVQHGCVVYLVRAPQTWGAREPRRSLLLEQREPRRRGSVIRWQTSGRRLVRAARKAVRICALDSSRTCCAASGSCRPLDAIDWPER
eukprot:TRINITY_DN1003_c0_g1_i3.p1 TRINITY_DN1003_c0_g1~~TRINITY_DN1003_c0_g1_i3.p1  ORF type:complete len:220 (+),score=19.92 TRINITY_DN1003_c0_g1_i3:184-843(+)